MLQTRAVVTRSLLACAAASVLAAAVPPDLDLDTLTRIRLQAFEQSQVMDTAAWLTDVAGARPSGSPALRRAQEWSKDRLQSYGLAGKLEPWGPFGRGWSLQRVSVHLVAPDTAPLVAWPRGWSPSTPGPVRGKLLAVKLEKGADFEAWRGKLAGKILLLDEPKELKPPPSLAFHRYDAAGLDEVARFEIGGKQRHGYSHAEAIRRTREARKLRQFLQDEKPLATLEASDLDDGVVAVSRGPSVYPGEPVGVPALVMAAEQYGRLARLTARKMDVEVEIDVRTRDEGENVMESTVVADLPGGSRRDEVVMLGAHIDSWHSGTGATDNAAGCAVVMEAARILASLGRPLARTVRVALFSGEEQGLRGSEAYVAQHFGAREIPDPAEADLPLPQRQLLGPVKTKAEHAKLSAYFNVDNGTGRVRGVWAQGNVGAAALFERWLVPVRDLGATTVTLRGTGGTDHMSFDDVGLPGFQLLQDEGDYETRTHHTHVDTYDRLQKADLMQASAVLAWLVYNAAEMPEMMPRKPIPPPPSPSATASPSPAPQS